MTDQDSKPFDEIIGDFDTAMLITRSSSGELHGRPMHIAAHNDEAQLSFATSIATGKIADIDADHRAAVTLQGGDRYVSLTGFVKISADANRIHALWSPAWQLWFPQGADDPTLRLIDFMPQSGAYWDISGGNRFEFLVEAGKALLQGEAIDQARLASHDKKRFSGP